MAELRIALAKASANSDRPEDQIPDLTIYVNKSAEDRGHDPGRDAEKMATALYRVLPGATLDLLTAHLMRKIASGLIVSHARTHRPASKDR